MHFQFKLIWSLMTLSVLCQCQCQASSVNDTTVVLGSESEVVIKTKLGQLRGQELTSRGGHKYYAFMGIPYAKATERFELAKPIKPWNGIKDATNSSKSCPQLVGFNTGHDVFGEENCHYLNVYYPHPERCSTNEQAKLPVVFFIHPGGFIGGFAHQFEPNYLMDSCLVFVSINFRLGALGFLTTDDGLIQGNLGHKDQVLALKWTKDNIDDFRGDKYSVTLMGASTGACSVQHLILSPAAKGLFHRAIAHSGSAISSIITHPGNKAEMLGRLLNCTFNSTSQLKSCLKSKDFKDIVRYQEQGKKWGTDPPSFGPVVELLESPHDDPTYEPILTRMPKHVLESGQFNRVPLITGFTEEEGILVKAGEIITNATLLQELNENWDVIAPITFRYDESDKSPEIQKNMSDKIRKFFFQNESISNSTFLKLANLYGDRYINYGIQKTIELHSKFAPVYPYVFTFKGQKSISEFVFGVKESAVSHMDDMPYIFHCPMSDILDQKENQEKSSSVIKKFSENLIALWTSFVIEGKPGTTWTEGVHWTEFDGNKNGGILKIDEKLENLYNYMEDRKQFWDNNYF